MSIYTLIVIIGTLMIIGGISLAATPLMTFVTAGYCNCPVLICAIMHQPSLSYLTAFSTFPMLSWNTIKDFCIYI